MTKQELLYEANRFRQAIEKAKAAGEFIPQKYKQERMNNFPHDCCDDTADLFTYYLYHKFRIDSIRVDSEYYDSYREYTCGHSWQKTGGWIIDLTGDHLRIILPFRLKHHQSMSGRWMTFTDILI